MSIRALVQELRELEAAIGAEAREPTKVCLTVNFIKPSGEVASTVEREFDAGYAAIQHQETQV